MEFRSKELYADLYENEGKPLVLIIGGSREGVWSVSPLLLDYLKEHYNVLIFAYFGVDKLPKSLNKIPLEYFIHGINLVKAKLNLQDQDIAIIGNSKGAEAALLLVYTCACYHRMCAKLLRMARYSKQCIRDIIPNI
jgi:hypothetical protein